MPISLDSLKQFGRLFGRGLIRQGMPGMAQGIINKWFHEWKVDPPRILNDVSHNRSLWDAIEPGQRQQLMALAQRVGNLDFITANLVVGAIKKDFPEVATLFVNWPEAGAWLSRQLQDVKDQISSSS